MGGWRFISVGGAGTGADRIVCKVSIASGRPTLFLPARERMAGIPEAWVDLEVDGKAYQADFKKIAVNVFHAEGAEGHVLAEVLRGWLGADAGLPGTSQAVEFVRQFGFEFKGFESQLGVVERPGVTLLFVTLAKSGQPERHKYQDSFLIDAECRVPSPECRDRQRLARHRELGVTVHLFVRARPKDGA